VSCLGVHIALSADQEEDVWTHFYDERVPDLVEALREDVGDEYRQATDKAWDAIHRCLSDGTLVWDAGRWPLRGAILGSESLCFSGDWVVMLLERSEVTEVAGALDAVTQEWFRDRFLALPGRGYDGAVNQNAFDYTWYWFERMRAFFRKTADEGRAMLFTADQ
jgi:Domain of unknown function (DUF1877)